jgi:hypothetical protein
MRQANKDAGTVVGTAQRRHDATESQSPREQQRSAGCFRQSAVMGARSQDIQNPSAAVVGAGTRAGHSPRRATLPYSSRSSVMVEFPDAVPRGKPALPVVGGNPSGAVRLEPAQATTDRRLESPPGSQLDHLARTRQEPPSRAPPTRARSPGCCPPGLSDAHNACSKWRGVVTTIA